MSYNSIMPEAKDELSKFISILSKSKDYYGKDINKLKKLHAEKSPSLEELYNAMLEYMEFVLSSHEDFGVDTSDIQSIIDAIEEMQEQYYHVF